MSVNYKSFFLNFFSANLIVRSLSLLKDMMLGWIIGPNKILDIFFFLITIPTVLTSTWNRALETVFLTRFEKDFHDFGKETALRNISLHVYNFTIISFIIYLLISAIFPIIIYNYYNEFVNTHLIYVVFLINIVFVFETFILGIKVLYFSQNRFFVPSIFPVFQSMVLILGLILFDKITLLLLSILFTFGALFQFLFFLMPEFRFFLKQIKINSNFKKSTQVGFKNIVQLSLASGLSSLNLIIDQSFALALGEGSNTYIHYGNYFILIYTFLIVNNISTIFFPQFQKYIISKQKHKLEEDARKVIRIILILNLFIIVLVLNNGYFFLNFLLGYGKIVGKDLEIIYLCTVAYSGAFFGLAINAIQVRIFHVYNHYNIIVWVAVLNLVLNFVFNYIFSKWFGVWGIALSTSVTLLILISVYFVYLKRHLALNLFKEGNYNWIIRFIEVAGLVGIIELYFLQHIHRSFEIDILWNGVVILVTIFFLVSLMYIFRVIIVRNGKLIF